MNRDCNRDPNRPIGNAVVVKKILEAILAGRQPPYRRAHHALAVIAELRHIAMYGRNSVFRHQLDEPLLAAADRHALRQQVALTFLGRSHVRQDQVQHFAIHAASAHQQYGRNTEAFLIRFHAPAASIPDSSRRRRHDARGWQHRTPAGEFLRTKTPETAVMSGR